MHPIVIAVGAGVRTGSVAALAGVTAGTVTGLALEERCGW